MEEDIKQKEESMDISIGSKIRALRKVRSISLQQMAKDLGMSYSYLSGLENDKYSVSITKLQVILKLILFLFLHLTDLYRGSFVKKTCIVMPILTITLHIKLSPRKAIPICRLVMLIYLLMSRLNEIFTSMVRDKKWF